MYTYEYPRPALTVDVVIFTLRDEQEIVYKSCSSNTPKTHSPGFGRCRAESYTWKNRLKKPPPGS